METRKPLLIEFIRYIFKPHIEVEARPKWFVILFNVIRLWGISFLISLFFATIANFFLARSGYGGDSFALDTFVTEFPIFFVLFMVVIWAPISEEFAFRLGLRFSPVKWGIGVAFLIMYLVSFLQFYFEPLQQIFSLISFRGILNSLLLLIVSFLGVFFLLRITKIKKLFQDFYNKYFRIIFYTMTISFAIVHITNYEVDLKTVWYFVPILVAPQLLLSFVISFVRMKYGFVWAVITHFLNNVMAIVPVLLLMPFSNIDVRAVEDISFSEIFRLLLAFFFLLGIFLICLVSILSLLLECTKKNK